MQDRGNNGDQTAADQHLGLDIILPHSEFIWSSCLCRHTRNTTLSSSITNPAGEDSGPMCEADWWGWHILGIRLAISSNSRTDFCNRSLFIWFILLVVGCKSTWLIRNDVCPQPGTLTLISAIQFVTHPLYNGLSSIPEFISGEP